MAQYPVPPRRGYSGGPPRNDGGRQTADPMEELLKPSTRLPAYFAGNERKAPRRELFDEDARKAAMDLKTLPASQLRRFYGAVVALRQQLELDETIPDDLVRARMAQLKAQAAYVKMRGKNYPDALVRFFTDHAAAVKDRDDFLRGFQPHFEAVVAYHKAFALKNGERT